MQVHTPKGKSAIPLIMILFFSWFSTVSPRLKDKQPLLKQFFYTYVGHIDGAFWQGMHVADMGIQVHICDP
jgi:hypothetical protein